MSAPSHTSRSCEGNTRATPAAQGRLNVFQQVHSWFSPEVLTRWLVFPGGITEGFGEPLTATGAHRWAAMGESQHSPHQTHSAWGKPVAACPWTRHPEPRQGTGSPAPRLPAHGPWAHAGDQLSGRLMGIVFLSLEREEPRPFWLACLLLPSASNTPGLALPQTHNPWCRPGQPNPGSLTTARIARPLAPGGSW